MASNAALAWFEFTAAITVPDARDAHLPRSDISSLTASPLSAKTAQLQLLMRKRRVRRALGKR